LLLLLARHLYLVYCVRLCDRAILIPAHLSSMIVVPTYPNRNTVNTLPLSLTYLRTETRSGIGALHDYAVSALNTSNLLLFSRKSMFPLLGVRYITSTTMVLDLDRPSERRHRYKVEMIGSTYLIDVFGLAFFLFQGINIMI
jgi:hypothetical protein